MMMNNSINIITLTLTLTYLLCLLSKTTEALPIRKGLSLTKSLAPHLVDFAESSSSKPLTDTVIKFASPEEIETGE